MRPSYQIVADFHKSRGGVAVSHAIAFGARIAQEALGVPLVTVHLAPAVLWSAHQAPVLPLDILPAWLPPPVKRAMYRFADAAVIDPVLAGPVNSFRGEFGFFWAASAARSKALLLEPNLRSSSAKSA